MTQELINEAEEAVETGGLDKSLFLKGGKIRNGGELVKQLVKALKEQQQTIDPKVLEKAIKGFKNMKFGLTYQMIYSKKVNAGEFAPEHSIEVSEDDDFYQIRKVERFYIEKGD